MSLRLDRIRFGRKVIVRFSFFYLDRNYFDYIFIFLIEPFFYDEIKKALLQTINQNDVFYESLFKD